jgi:hypothetical protein
MGEIEESKVCGDCQGTGLDEASGEACLCTLSPLERALADRRILNGGSYTRLVGGSQA